MGIFFRYFLIQRIRKIQSNMRKRPGIRSKTLPKLGVENFFFEIFRNWPRFFDLKDVKLNSESNGTGQKFQKSRDFAQESIKCQNFFKNAFFHDAYAKSRDFAPILKGVILLRIQFCICWAVLDTYPVTVRRFASHANYFQSSEGRRSEFLFEMSVYAHAYGA